ncbi:rhamnogalacturonan acetylesterase [Galbibacter marinus]|uniref:Rhamnogalacturonan acetylesterase n=1 Tax=Galbibacter marinus TaxID=555500 RepID=K2PS48_9FLAO|nr:rhamnogalacturonan acetylesterase [Galbibacter marinus]EKF55360.1 rhamnogalacturonan acetylesterase [Galbibacter marinus]
MIKVGTSIKKQLAAVLLVCLTTLSYGQGITIYTIGDSTMANKPDTEQNPERGWVQMLPAFFNQDITIVNKAINGRSTRSFIDEGRWKEVYQMLQPGDYVFIQFGHNDQKEKSPDRYTNPHTAYRHNLIQFVTQSRSKGAIPILFTSIVRRNFNTQGTLIDTHGSYPLEVRLVAQQYKVDFIDLQYLTEILEMSYGVEKSKELHLHYTEREIPYFPKGKQDDTHLSVKGATEVCKLVVEQLKASTHPLSNYLIE